MASPAEIVATLLSATAVTSPLFALKVGKLTDTPDEQICTYDSGGENPNPAWLLNEPHVQIRVRGKSFGYGIAWAKASLVRDAILGITPQNVTGGRIDGIIALGDINYIGPDQKERPEFTMNFKMFFEPASGTYRLPL